MKFQFALVDPNRDSPSTTVIAGIFIIDSHIADYDVMALQLVPELIRNGTAGCVERRFS